jgi:hypothetical protein
VKIRVLGGDGGIAPGLRTTSFLINDHCYGAVTINTPGAKPDCHTFAKGDQGWLSTVSADSLTLFARGSTDLIVGRSQDPTHVGACKLLLASHDPNMMERGAGDGHVGGCSMNSRQVDASFASLFVSMTLIILLRRQTKHKTH